MEDKYGSRIGYGESGVVTIYNPLWRKWGLKLFQIKGSEKILEMEGKLVLGRMFGWEIHLFM
jgi:hypothetical protein